MSARNMMVMKLQLLTDMAAILTCIGCLHLGLALLFYIYNITGGPAIYLSLDFDGFLSVMEIAADCFSMHVIT